VRRLTALWGGRQVGIGELSQRIRRALLEGGAEEPRDAGLHAQVARLERGLIAEMLVQTGGNKSRTARELGLSRQGLAKKMRRFGMRWLGGEARAEPVTARSAGESDG
jgi:DNA-binding NtrC family response regulator